MEKAILRRGHQQEQKEETKGLGSMMIWDRHVTIENVEIKKYN